MQTLMTESSFSMQLWLTRLRVRQSCGKSIPMTWQDRGEVLDFVNSREKPLAFYYFGNVKDGRYLIAHTSSGGACINDTIMHFANANMPFGGVGNSGQGKYHERETFLAFSHTRSVLNTSSRIDLPFRYMPCPELPTPPKGMLALAKCIMVSLMQAPPLEVCLIRYLPSFTFPK